MPRNTGMTRAEELESMVAASVGAGEERHLETVDFNDPNRPKTCLEVDFPILPINQIAQIEGNAGKPIYQMSKWWARRRSSVFRSTLLAAATKAPDDPAEAAKVIWDNYYGNHQKNESFKKLKVADIFMGGGTTLVEGSRLGMQMSGNDLNPVAWLVVKNELSDVDVNEVERLFDHIEKEVKPLIMPFYVTEGPEGEKGKWIEIESKNAMPDNFDPLDIPVEERKKYRYEGPEVIYSFWAKHGPCSAPECNHRTPLLSSSVIATKQLSIKTWADEECVECNAIFDVEMQEARMAPDSPLVVSPSEKPYAVLDNGGTFKCPSCGKSILRKLDKGKNKRINLSLLICPEWMKGAAGTDECGELGGTVSSNKNGTIRWNNIRQSNLRFIEVRGDLPVEIRDPDTHQEFQPLKGTIPRKSKFECQEATCGKQQDVLDAIKASGKSGPMAVYSLQCFSPNRNKRNYPYNGRYFKSISIEDVKRLNAAIAEWEIRRNSDLKGYWPESELPYGFMTHHLQGGVPNHGFTHWHTMFNPRQLLVHSQIFKAIDEAEGFSNNSKEIALGVAQQYLRNQNMFCFWNSVADKMEPMFSNNNYHPKSTVIEGAVLSDLGRGNLASCFANTIKGLKWKRRVWETVSNEMLSTDSSFEDETGKSMLSGKSSKAFPQDVVLPGAIIRCGSSTELSEIETGSLDLVVTDPPFGGLLHYSELADFFYVWLRLLLKKDYPQYFTGEYTPKTLEAVANRARNPENPDGFYKRVLTDCWKEANRLLKPSGILSFTFHHSEDEPWVDVLESLFDSGFFLEATYPIRSDETKGKGEFGSKTIEYDIIHVCRKRTEEPSKISWPKLRRQILRDVRQLQDLLEHHQQEGLPQADIEVIKRGKALEYFSRHYGKVYVEEEREFTVKEALAGINQILDDQSGTDAVRGPDKAEPLTRQFLRIFAGQQQVARDQMQKFLRGSGIGPSDFMALGWCKELSRPKAFLWTDPLEKAKSTNGLKSTRRDLDQAFYMVGACYDSSGINLNKEMQTEDFKPHPVLGELLNWLGRHGPTLEFRNASQVARHLFNTWSAEHQTILSQQLSLFDMEEE